MAYKWIDPEVFIKHKCVTIYHVYRNDDIDQGRRKFWYTTDPYGGECNDCSFDIRELKSYSPEKSHEQIIREAIDIGEI